MDKIRLGLVGAGRIGQVHAASITYQIPQAEIVRVSDVKLEAAREVAERFGIAAYGNDFMQIVNDPDIDAVLVCSPTPTPVSYTHLDVYKRQALRRKGTGPPQKTGDDAR